MTGLLFLGLAAALTPGPYALEVDVVTESKLPVVGTKQVHTISSVLAEVHEVDGVLVQDQRTCAECARRTRCTPQVRLDLIVDAQPLRLLLAHTSAKNFLLYETQLAQSGIALYDRLHRICVINRGSWGELRFGLQE